MKKEANIQRMAEKQKEAKLAVCAILYLRISFMHSFVLLFIACCHICVMKAKQVVISLHVAYLRQDWLLTIDKMLNVLLIMLMSMSDIKRLPGSPHHCVLESCTEARPPHPPLPV